MLISIIIPVYNVEAYLTECLDSVYNQFIDGCEVVAVNDGSTDNSRQILANYQIKYPEFIVIDQENRGLSGARNTGMTHSTGEYLYFLDSDDYLLPNAINIILNAIERTRAEVIGFNAIVNDNTVYIPSYRVSDKVKTGIDFFVDFYKDNGTYPTVNVWLYTYKKIFLQNINLKFKEGLFHEDVLFSMLVFYYAKRVNALNYAILNYRQHREGSICTNIKLKNLTDRTSVCRELDAFYKSKNIKNKHFYAVLFHQYLFNLQLAVTNNLTSERKFFFSTVDENIMKKGISSQYEFKLWVLASINIKLLHAYYYNKLNKYFQRFINIVFTVILQCCYKTK